MRRRRNPFGVDLGNFLVFGAIIGGVVFVASKLKGGGGPPDSGIRIGTINYFAWVRTGAHQDFQVFLSHKGPGGAYKIRVVLTTGTSAIPAAFGQHGTPVWEQFLYVSYSDAAEWTPWMDFHVTGNLNVDILKTYNIYVAVLSPSGQVAAEVWRDGAIYVAP